MEGLATRDYGIATVHTVHVILLLEDTISQMFLDRLLSLDWRKSKRKKVDLATPE